MRLFTAYDTQWLTRASFEPAAALHLRNGLRMILASLLLVAAGVFGFSRLQDLLTPPGRFAEMGRRNAALTDEIERGRMELEMERATRAELQRQIDAMGKQITELNHQIEFLSSRTAQPDPASYPGH
jgi:hypothetical protein